ncbi:MAG TPA: hypothetical protein VK585_15700, partial [Jiangellaceae bacterium]|nr:hypothetical protein [Jiangellaceae bacterium]
SGTRPAAASPSCRFPEQPTQPARAHMGPGRARFQGPSALTRAGITAHAALLAKVSSSRRQVTAGITPDDYLATVEVLRRMAANLGWDDPGGGPSR